MAPVAPQGPNRFGSSLSLPIWLALFSIAFALPIFWFAYVAEANVRADLRLLDSEVLGVRFDAEAARLVALGAGLTPGLPVEMDTRENVGITLKELDDEARIFQAAALESDVLSPVRQTWPAVEGGPNGTTLGAFEEALAHSMSLISDASQLSFESHIDEADLQDAQFVETPLVVQSLGVAAVTAELDPPGKAIPVADRIAIAKLTANSSTGSDALTTDMLGLFRADPRTRARLEGLWQAQSHAADTLLDSTQSAMNGAVRDPQMAFYRDNLVAATQAFSSALNDVLLARFELRRDHDRFEERLIVVASLAATLIGALLLAMIGRAIVRRDRRELLRVRAEARTLTAELARQQAERALSLTEAQFRAILDRSQMGIALLDEDGGTIEANEAVAELLGSNTDVVSADDHSFRALLAGTETSYIFERSFDRADGARRWAEVNVSVVSVAHPTPVVALAMIRDVTERKAIDDRLLYAATHDPVTALPNRQEFMRYLETVLVERTATGRNFAVLFIDLDDFKLVNDRLGHHAGDRLLVLTARRLLSLSRAGDIVARFHGDEFAILMRDVRDLDTAKAIAERVQVELSAPVAIDGSTATVTSSIGIVMGTEAYQRAEDVMRNADAAMYHAKSAGRSTAVVFDDDMLERLGTRMRMIADLPGGIERDEFFLAYQPVVDLSTGSGIGFEALMRWNHPTFGIVPPTTFIPLAEESGAIIELGRYALRKACSMLAARGAVGNRGQTLSIAVNLAVDQLMEATIVRDVERALVESGLPPHLLMLEITESALLEDGPRAVEVLSRLKALGVRLCIDDFGTGYSSLRYLHQFPIDALKIDRSFVNGRDGGLANEPIVQMVITLASSLGMDVIAEGVESSMQREKLFAAGCQVGQGYLFSRPIDRAEELDRWFGVPLLADSG